MRFHRIAAHLLAVALLVVAGPAFASRIGELSETSVGEQILRFITLQDRAILYAVIGTVLIGINCGLLGSYMVVRRLSMIGDTLSHAVLPGICLGFLFAGERAPVPIFIGAVIAGVSGTYLLGLITQTTRIPKDAAMGIVLSAYFGVGISLLTYIQQIPGGNKSGLSNFLFGQSAAFSREDLYLLGLVTALVVVVVTFFHKEMLTLSFDHSYATTLGIPTQFLHYLQMTCLAFAIVVGIQAVGVVLVSAMLITPAATAYLLKDRLSTILLVAVLLGCLSGILGTFFSFLWTGLPTGPFIVVAATALFLPVYLCAPKYGVLTRWWRHRSSSVRTKRENTLKAIYHIFEREGFSSEQVGILELARYQKEPEETTRGRVRDLVRAGFASRMGDTVVLSPAGFQRAWEIVRNHRLWELYLVKRADLTADQVHENAEEIEHLLSHEMIHDLESVLKFPRKDPHGKPIPGYMHARLLGTVDRDSEGRSGEGLLDIYSQEGKGDS